jgi:hypothetical protein
MVQLPRQLLRQMITLPAIGAVHVITDVRNMTEVFLTDIS